ncbi:hypothetical protein ANN_20235 [Periplaneta americana]|uniref:Uncharacterized protein n=1 Tax=Periplaneta americana TaxID=6978 RepID=A0ABQ8SC32_PERAM|nr:hypothetical protein ANN_20235 [Periplaneta americana]
MDLREVGCGGKDWINLVHDRDDGGLIYNYRHDSILRSINNAPCNGSRQRLYKLWFSKDAETTPRAVDWEVEELAREQQWSVSSATTVIQRYRSDGVLLAFWFLEDRDSILYECYVTSKEDRERVSCFEAALERGSNPVWTDYVL